MKIRVKRIKVVNLLFFRFLCFFCLSVSTVFSQENVSKKSLEKINNSGLSDIEETELLESVRYHVKKKEYKEAKVFLLSYYEQFSESLELNWLYAYVLSLNGEKKEAVKKFEKATLLAPENVELQKEYARFLYKEIGDVDKTDKVLSEFVDLESTEVEFLLMKANIDYWKGNIKESKALVDRIHKLYPGTDITSDLVKNLEQVTSAYLKANFEYQKDSQPLEYIAEHIEIGQYRSKYFSPRLYVSNYNYSPQSEQALILKLGNEFYMDKLNLKATVTGGAYKNFSGETDWVGGLDVTEEFTKDFSLNLGYAKKSLLTTIASTTSNLTYQDLYGAVDYQNKFIAVHAGYSHQLYDDENIIRSFISWIVSQPVKFRKFSFQVGYSYGYFDSDKILFVLNESTSDFEDGLYDPYFTPNNQTNHAALFIMDYKPSSKLTLSTKINYGFAATFLNPFFYKTDDLDNLIASGFYKEENLKPKEITGSINYSFTSRFSVKATYLYQETFFYDRDNINIGLNYIF